MESHPNHQDNPFKKFVPYWVFLGIPVGAIGLILMLRANLELSWLGVSLLLSSAVFTVGGVLFIALRLLQWRIIDLLFCFVLGSVPSAIWYRTQMRDYAERWQFLLTVFLWLLAGILFAFVGIVFAKSYMRRILNPTFFQRAAFNFLGIIQIICLPFYLGLLLFLIPFILNQREFFEPFLWCGGGTVVGVISILLAVRLERQWSDTNAEAGANLFQ